MENPTFLDDLTRRIRDVFSQSPAADVEKNLRALLVAFFNRLDLVTREEFDVQQALLARTREKLEALEKKVAELEQAQFGGGRAGPGAGG